MNASKKSIIQVVVFFLIAFGLIYWQYQSMTGTQIQEIKLAIRDTKWAYLFYAIIVGFLSHLMRALRWRMLLQASGIRPRVKSTTIAVLLGYLANTLIPRLGEIIRCSTMTKTEGVPFEQSIGTVISERLFDVLSLLILFLLVFALEYDTLSVYGSNLLSRFFYDELGALKTGKLLGLAALLFVGVIMIIVVFKKMKNNKLKAILQNGLAGLRSIFQVRNKFLFLLYTICMWMLYVLMVYVAFRAVSATEHLGWIPAMAVTAFGSIAIIFTPGGIGAYPPVAAAILSFYQVEAASGIAAGWVSWTMQTAVVIILGLLALAALSFISPHKPKEYEPTPVGTSA